MRDTVQGLLDALYLASIWIAGVAILIMSFIIPWGVFARYVLGSGSQWPEPIAILLMLVFTFIGAAASYRAGSHIAVTLLTDVLPAFLRRSAGLISNLLMVVICLFVIVYGARLCAGTWGQSVSELPWMPVGFSYLPLPVGGVLTLIFVIERLVLGPQAHRGVVRREQDDIRAEH
jgi:TRAP-type C4-dicarboxylate transport system permease small subunit